MCIKRNQNILAGLSSYQIKNRFIMYMSVQGNIYFICVVLCKCLLIHNFLKLVFKEKGLVSTCTT